MPHLGEGVDRASGSIQFVGADGYVRVRPVVEGGRPARKMGT